MTAPSAQLSVAAVQLAVGADKEQNIARVGALVAEAAARGAELVVLPEKWNGFGTPEVLRACAEPLSGGASIDAMRAWAVEHGITLVGGSITELDPVTGRLSNTSLAIDARGEIVGTYRKIHLFDVEVGSERYRESDVETAGDEVVSIRHGDWNVGITICYDLRFPELFRILALRGAGLIVVPAAFTMMTGRDHWELLLRARAVENQCYVLGADEFGVHPGGKRTYGRSTIVDPWGTVLAQAPDGDAVVVATLDPERLSAIRASLPALANRRPDAYRRAADGAADMLDAITT